ncbi:hypothetical protein GRX03_15670 [Halovenus sp. WSH3]|uniref:Uncharacterized protein n=1 Tax=Halovenus carboxidivorans TaxID=2692199 RepID=A0A6B0T9W5_9EURY|nr:hypothetical protein [Halovenus carboxidivorans]MXR53036.1 hypothetical protein [Halovenus carboxidivorans]
MTGFKSGASDDDPLAADDETTEESQRERATGRAQSTPAEEESSDIESSTEQTSEARREGLPWIYSRNSITDGRAKTVQLHLQESTLTREREARTEVPIDETVNKADLREAAYLVGLQHLDEVGSVLREWGYDLD